MAAEAHKPVESGEERASQIRVLIAEDNMINMKVAMGILRRMGYVQVVFPPTPYHALMERLRRAGLVEQRCNNRV